MTWLIQPSVTLLLFIVVSLDGWGFLDLDRVAKVERLLGELDGVLPLEAAPRLQGFGVVVVCDLGDAPAADVAALEAEAGTWGRARPLLFFSAPDVPVEVVGLVADLPLLPAAELEPVLVLVVAHPGPLLDVWRCHQVLPKSATVASRRA